MGQKLFVLTAGTEAASVGQEIEKQMKTHPNSELQVMVRYLDTAYLPNRYSSLHSQEWFQMSIDPRYIQAIYDTIADYPEIQRILFPGLLPGTDQSGGGAIRYNGAGAVEIQREKLRRWLSASLADLAGWGSGETTISIALIISAVGATGSGSVEHLLNLLVDAANYAGVKSTTQSAVRCDLYILQPGKKNVTDLGLANTLALYAELAASQLSLQKSRSRHYQGRKIIIGWGSNFILASMEQLKEAAASIVRLSTDTTTAFSAEFWEREVDNHVLRELDPRGLPMHLSLATVVTINTGTLVEQVIRRDTEQLIDLLVLGQTENRQPGLLLAKFSRALAGGAAQERYRALQRFLATGLGFERMRGQIEDVLQEPSTLDGKLQTLHQLYRRCEAQLEQGQKNLIDKAHVFVSEALEECEHSKRELIGGQGLSLSEVRAEFRLLEDTVRAVYGLAIDETNRSRVDEAEVQRLLNEVRKAKLPRTRQERLRELTERMVFNLTEKLREVARDAALIVLDALQRYSANVGLKLDVVLQRLRKEKKRQEERMHAQGKYVLDTSHPLHLMALDNDEEVRNYAEKISVLSTGPRQLVGARRDNHEQQLSDFRVWLTQQSEFEALFEGDSDHLAETVQAYVRQRVKEAVGRYKLIDHLLADGEEKLLKKFREAANRAISLVSFSPDFAPDLREAWCVSADYRIAREELDGLESEYPEDRVKRSKLEKAISKAFTGGYCKLLKSRDSSEIALFYYVDGLPLSAIEDLKGRCLEAFLNRRKRWQQQQKLLNQNAPQLSIGGLNQRVGVPVYSGRDAEERVKETGVIRRLYQVKGAEVGDYRVEDVPELGEHQANAPTHSNGHGTTPANESELRSYSAGYQGQANANHGPSETAHQAPLELEQEN